MTCDHCGKQVPDAVFCTNCGAHQGLADHAIAAQERPHHFAAHPGEHVSQPSVFTTLFPHLGHRKLQEFRWALTLGFALVVVLVATGLIVAAVLVSIFLVPDALRGLSLRGDRCIARNRRWCSAATLGGGIVLGLAVTILSERIIGGGLASTGVPIVSYGIVLPIIQLIVMPIPALLLRRAAAVPGHDRRTRLRRDGRDRLRLCGRSRRVLEPLLVPALRRMTPPRGSFRSHRWRCWCRCSMEAPRARSLRRCGDRREPVPATGSRSSAYRLSSSLWWRSMPAA